MLRAYLDQNHVIELLRSAAGRATQPGSREARETLFAAVQSGRAICPLSRTHIIETARVGNNEKRQELAAFLADLSDGWFLAGRSTRLAAEVATAVGALFGIDVALPRPPWPLTQNLLEAFGSIPYLAHNTGMSERFMEVFSKATKPNELIRWFLAFPSEPDRRKAIEEFSHGAQEDVTAIEHRRSRLRSETPDLRWRAHGASLFVDHQNFIVVALHNLGKTPDDLRQLGTERVQRLIDDVPTLHVERCLAFQAEQQYQRPIAPNDLNDLDMLCGAIPYCDLVLTEHMWASLAAHPFLGHRYKATVTATLADLTHVLKQAR